MTAPLFRGEYQFLTRLLAARSTCIFMASEEGTPMKKFVALSMIAAASLGLAACSKSADTTENAAAAADLNATEANAIEDINAATTEALNDADAALDNAGAAVDNAADAVTNAM